VIEKRKRHHSVGESVVRQCGRTSDWMVHSPVLMEKIMSKSNDTSKLDHTKLENRVLADSELDAVSGGARTDPGDDDDKMSGGELAALYRSKFGFKLQQAS
jgi:hypothetical protein